MAYFDAASSLPPHPVAREALLAALDEGWADPTRLHREGRRARMLLDAARESAAESVGCRADELSFTASGTHALHTGIAGALTGRRRASRRLLVSAVEHSAVLHAAEAHERAGGSVGTVPVTRTGRVDPRAYADALDGAPDEGAALACLQSANHEVGTVQPVADVASLCAERGVPLLVDAAQSLGWAPVEAGWSLLTASAHKWGGPGGVGLLAVRKGARFAAPGPSDERELGRAPGFAALPGIVAAAASLRAVRERADDEAARLRELVARLRDRIPALVPDTEVVGEAGLRLPHLLTFSCLYVDGEALLHALDREGFSVSSGSSCTSSTLTPSHVLRAMDVLSEGNVRVSLPPGTAEEEVERFLSVLPRAVSAVRDRLTATPATASGHTGGQTRAEEPRPGRPPAEAELPDDRPDLESSEAEADGGPGDEGPAAELTVDALGKRCPLPVIELSKVVGEVPPGGVVTVLADDEAARLDIPAWCRMRGHEYLGSHPAAGAGARESGEARKTGESGRSSSSPGTAYRVRRVS